MSSQFEKRKAKSTEEISREIQDKRSEIRASREMPPVVMDTPVYTQTGLDIYTPDGGRTYKIAEILYNPETMQAEVKEIFNITRLVALQYANTKTGLGTLKKKIKN